MKALAMVVRVLAGLAGTVAAALATVALLSLVQRGDAHPAWVAGTAVLLVAWVLARSVAAWTRGRLVVRTLAATALLTTGSSLARLATVALGATALLSLARGDDAVPAAALLAAAATARLLESLWDLGASAAARGAAGVAAAWQALSPVILGRWLASVGTEAGAWGLLGFALFLATVELWGVAGLVGAGGLLAWLWAGTLQQRAARVLAVRVRRTAR